MSLKAIALSIAAVSALAVQPVFAQAQPAGVLPSTTLGFSTGAVAFTAVAAVVVVEGSKTTSGTTGTTGTR